MPSMPRRKKSEAVPNEQKTVDYRYSHEKRINIPPARIAGEGSVPTVPKAKYAYSPHLPPTLQFDPTGEPDKLNDLLAKAMRGPLSETEVGRLRDALRVKEPTLEWAGKREQREKGFLEVDPVALHIHERVSARAIIRSALREDVQRDLFADPQQPYQQAVQFYKHDVDWANRLILGDSLQVMSSLARRENLAGKVQMIYMDPPYGIKFASNFQSEIGNRTVGEKEQDLTREPEMVRAYRDTWQLGTHSYLAYLRDRLMLAQELLTQRGSIFVQISDENVHRVRNLLDEIFGPENFCSLITFRKKLMPLGSDVTESVSDYILWYAVDRKALKVRSLFRPKPTTGDAAWSYIELPSGERRKLSTAELHRDIQLPSEADVFQSVSLLPAQYRKNQDFLFAFEGREYPPPKRVSWKTDRMGMTRLAAAGRLVPSGETLRYVLRHRDYPVTRLTHLWADTAGADDPRYVVQTNTEVVKRCMLLTTDPGDLVVDPTCGSGTTAFVAEQWGRRWITIDTSRVALSVARQRMMTGRYEHYKLRDGTAASGGSAPTDPSRGFVYKTVPHVTLGSIAQNEDLDDVVERHRPLLDARLAVLNAALQEVTPETRARLRRRLQEKETLEGKRAIVESDRRRWLLPEEGWKHWEVPFEPDGEWPKPLTERLRDYRAAWRARRDEIDATIALRSEQENLVDQPEVVRSVVRVSGPFTVEGVHPEELNVGEGGLFDGTPNSFEEADEVESSSKQQQNVHAYLARMVQLIRHDGLTFLSNKRRQFAHVEPLFDAATGSTVHAEGSWSDSEAPDALVVAIGFGPQYGPVTAVHVEELLRASKRHTELVIAGFSFDAAATALVQEYSNPKCRIHQAYIRPDVNPGMDGLLKDTANSQLFTVFGTPEIAIDKNHSGEWEVELKGVDIYDPVANTIRSTGAEKVSAWFLDRDFDGRCFCVTQAFFPDQDAWEKIAKALGSAADADAFEAFKGTRCIPFAAGKHKRIAVKVIDPRGNEVMAVRSLEA